MLYVTKRHPKNPDAWALCADGQIVFAQPDDKPRSYARCVAELTKHDDGWNTILAAGGEDEGFVSWESDPAIAFVGVETSDWRIIDSVKFRQTPLPQMANRETTAWGHEGAVLIGRVDTIAVDGENVTASGVIDVSRLDGADVAHLLSNDMLKGVSIDGGPEKIVTEVLEEDDDGWPTKWLDHYVDYEVSGFTHTPFPAFGGAAVKLSSVPVPAPSDADDGVQASGTLDIPVEPDVLLFDEPHQLADLPMEQGIHVEGHHVYGWVAPWGQCHIGINDRCVVAPKSATGYAYFHLGAVRCETGCDIKTGVLTMGTGHADKSLPGRVAAAHYDNTGYGVADIAIGENDRGIWFSGALRPGVTAEQIREMRASKVSGDWRRFGSSMELVATLVVNVGGFPPYEEGITASGEVQTIIASLVPGADGTVENFNTLPAHLVRTLEELHVRGLQERVHVT